MTKTSTNKPHIDIMRTCMLPLMNGCISCVCMFKQEVVYCLVTPVSVCVV